MIPNHGPSLDFDLGETADAIRETTARFAADRIAPLAAEIDRTNDFPRQLWPEMGELGLLGPTARTFMREMHSRLIYLDTGLVPVPNADLSEATAANEKAAAAMVKAVSNRVFVNTVVPHLI